MAPHSRSAFLLLFGCFCVWSTASATESHECDRPCSRSGSKKVCRYDFTVGVSFQKYMNVRKEKCRRRASLSINGISPGPSISVCQNDTIVVDVRNVLPSGMELSIHWHGLVQRGSAHMDGVTMITQCPIHSGTTFRYRMRAEKPGTFYYHAHSVFQQLDGIFGALIVRDLQEEGTQAISEKVVMFAPVLEKLKSFGSSTADELSVAELKSYTYDLSNKSENGGTTIKAKLINAAAMNCPLSVTSTTTAMTLEAVDGNNVERTNLSHLLLYPGERADIVINSNFSTEIEIYGRNLCSGQKLVGLTRDALENPAPLVPLRSQFEHLSVENYIKQLKSDSCENTSSESYRIYLPFDVAKYSDLDCDIDFRYKLGSILPHIPSQMSLDSLSIYEFHNVSFLYPSSPLLTQPNSIDTDMMCALGKKAKLCDLNKSDFCECLQILKLPFNRIIDLVIFNEGRIGKSEQTFHLHGHSFQIVQMESLEKPITTEDIRNLAHSYKEILNPVEKDTVAVPANGFVTIRLKTNNPGNWLLESIPSKSSSEIGLELILQVVDPYGINQTPKGFPQCGSLKAPDLVIFEEP